MKEKLYTIISISAIVAIILFGASFFHNFTITRNDLNTRTYRETFVDKSFTIVGISDENDATIYLEDEYGNTFEIKNEEYYSVLKDKENCSLYGETKLTVYEDGYKEEKAIDLFIDTIAENNDN